MQGTTDRSQRVIELRPVGEGTRPDRRRGSRPMRGQWCPRVLAQPAGHPSMRRLEDGVATLVTDLPADWEALSPSWIAAHAHEWDVAHLLLGHDLPTMPAPDRGWSAADLLEVLRAHREHAVPTVVTVHDLDAVVDPREGMTALELLAEARSLICRVVTPTHGAAAEIAAATGEHPTVIPHGPALDAGEIGLARRWRRHAEMLGEADGPVVVPGGWRDDLDVAGVLDAVRALPGSRSVRVLVAERSTADRAGWALADGLEVVVVDPTDPLEIARELAPASVAVLPLRRGTHSWLVELAADVGVPVIASDVGHLGEQHPLLEVPVGPDGVDADALADAILTIPSRGLVSSECQRERAAHAFMAGHDRLYDRVGLGPTFAPPPPPAGTATPGAASAGS